LLRDTDEKLFGSNLEELLKRYPILKDHEHRFANNLNNLNRDHIYAEILYHLSQDLNNLRRFSDEESVVSDVED
jgi:hypothetical protein